MSSQENLREKAPSAAVENARETLASDLRHDQRYPENWSARYRWLMLVLITSIELSTNLAVLICTPAIPQILDDLKSSDRQRTSVIIVTIWNLGGILGFFFLGPLSEIYGRRPVYNIANVFFILFTVGTALSQNVGMLIAFRFLNGTAIASQALNNSITSDMFPVGKRGTAQSIAAVIPMLGPVIGPPIGGYLAQSLSWRWSFWFIVILVGAQQLGIAVFLRETYEPVITRKLQRERNVSHEEQGLPVPQESFRSKFELRAFLRPFSVFTMPVFLFPASCVALAYGYIYILLTTIAEVFQGEYGFSTGASGLAYLGMGTGMGIATFVCSATLDWYTQRMSRRNNGEIKPEWRLPLVTVGGLFTATGLFIYGWTAQAHTHWIVPIIGTAFVGFSISATTIPVITYLADVFEQYRASALASMNIFRQVVSIVLPLCGPPLYSDLGYGWGNSVLAFIALAMVPVPIVFLIYGERWRLKSGFLRKLKEAS